MYKNNISIMGTENSYAVLFSRAGKKPHVIYGKGNGMEQNLVAAATRGIKLAHGSEIIFRTNNEHIRKLLARKVQPLENEQELIQLLESKKMTISVRKELDGYIALMSEAIDKKEKPKKETPSPEVSKPVSKHTEAPIEESDFLHGSIGLDEDDAF